MAEQRITTKPTVSQLLDEDYLFINHDGSLRQVRKDAADLASAAGLAAEATARQQFEENLTEANEEFVETVDERMDAAESIVYGAFAIGTASGSIASFNDGADDIPVKSLKVAIVPKQSGSGDPSPSNVRPIAGWMDADVNVVGANLLDDSNATLNAVSRNGEMFTNTSTDSRTYFNLIVQYFNGGTYIGASTALQITTAGRYSLPLTIPNGTTAFRIKHSGSQRDFYVACNFNHTGEFILSLTVTSANPTVVGGLVFGNLQIETGTTATDYHPYTATTTPISWQTEAGTVYGGELDVTTGVLTINRGFYTYTNISTTSGTAVTGGWRCDFACQSDDVNRGKWSVQTGGQPVLSMFNEKAMNEGGVSKGYSANSYTVIVPNATSKAEADSALNGMQIAYILATPTTVQLTPTEVKTLLGANNLWSDAGDVTAEYRKDPTIALANLEALILENL